MTNTSSKEITERLKIARITAGYKSSRAFAIQNSFPEVSYTQHETNKRKMTAESAVEYSKSLDVNVAWVLTGQGYPSALKKRNKEIIEYIFAHRAEADLAVSLPNINKGEICSIDVDTLNEILTDIINTSIKNKLDINCSDLLDFTYKLYNNVCTTLDLASRRKMIEIATESLISANSYSEKKQKTN